MATTNSPSIAFSQDDIDMTTHNDVANFEELFNFEEFESAGESSTHGNSPATESNATPSPLPTQDPLFHDTSFDFFNTSMDTDYPIGLSLGDSKDSKAAFTDEIVVKQEPVDYPVFDTQSPASNPVPAQPVALSFGGLPVDQQAALQQLMENIMNYQEKFGAELPGMAASPAEGNAQTIEPSMLFTNSPASDSAAVPTQPMAVAPAAQSAPATTSNTPAVVVAPSPVPAPLVAPISVPPTTQPAEKLEEPLRSISEEPNRTRGASTVSFEDLDSRIDRLVPLPEIFSAGKGKGGKKGGGMSSVVREDGEDLDDDESWRPSPEEYKKLSSKEKRQLRNKLSARAFRTRRKDYIGTLEAHIKDRDMVIDEMRNELIHSRNENQDLRKELAALKASTMSILHPESASKSFSPAMVSALAKSPAVASAASSTTPNGPVRRPGTPLNTYNPRKDLPSSLKGGWGNDNMFSGGSTICHTIMTPDLVLPSSNPAPLRSFADLPRVNLNPHLNEPAPSTLPHTLSNTASGADGSSTFSEWSENTPWSLRSMDSYRMQIWSRLAKEAAADKANLAGDLRPKFFVEGPSTPSPTAADVAGAATSHVTSKLASSFWSAFTQGSSKSLDSDKLAAVVTGQAKLKVVPVNQKEGEEDVLAALMGGLKMQSGVSPCERRRAEGARENPLGVLCGFLKHAGAMTC
ncbi:hypothetical protein J008_05532 [Cryptococcus neoformans]|nr:hypothetical protein C367_05448 [Cryptococcus neoformans var. grubii Ze90-1]OXH24904.1 hypothetical protein J008_05532 [Cryptococcus neoformans var. grubii]